MRYARVNDGVVLEIVDLPDSIPVGDGKSRKAKVSDFFNETIASDFFPCGDDVAIGWGYRGSAYSPPSNQGNDGNFQEIKASLKIAVDTMAEQERKRYITAGEGQAMTYQRKVEEAKRAVLEEDPVDAEYPMLSASLGIDGETVKLVAAVVLSMDAEWAAIGAAIEKVRMSAKKAIDDALNFEDATAAVDAIIWPVA
ncbi:hypothetical protein [Agrobacterium deltaense]|nr:hypothetical protein [Agrobacterium deltaense]